MKSKTCTYCNETKSLDMFGKNKRSPDGYHSQCNPCKAGKHRERRAAIRAAGGYDIAVTEKRCRSCKQTHPASEFTIDRTMAAGLASYCKSCNSSRLVTHRYGLTPEAHQELYEQQDHSCAMCGTHESEAPGAKLHVDHCHTTGDVRGLLCSNCNRAIGLLQDDPVVLRAGIEYLKQHSK